jgi:hypothetical protein
VDTPVRHKRHVEDHLTADDCSVSSDEKLYGPNHSYTAATISELAATYYLAKKHDLGVPLMIRLEGVIPNNPAIYAPGSRSRKFVKQLFEKYADAMRAIGSTSEAERFQQIAASL